MNLTAFDFRREPGAGKLGGICGEGVQQLTPLPDNIEKNDREISIELDFHCHAEFSVRRVFHQPEESLLMNVEDGNYMVSSRFEGGGSSHIGVATLTTG